MEFHLRNYGGINQVETLARASFRKAESDETMKYSIKLRNAVTGEVSYLSHRNKTSWCIKVARKHAREMSKTIYFATLEEE